MLTSSWLQYLNLNHLNGIICLEQRWYAVFNEIAPPQLNIRVGWWYVASEIYHQKRFEPTSNIIFDNAKAISHSNSNTR